MKQTRIRLGSQFLAIAMLLTLLPVSALASDKSVAKIGDNEYTTLSAAFEAVGNEAVTITLLKDTVVSAPITIDPGKTVTLDMQKHNITVSSDFSTRVFTNNGNLTIQGNGTIDVTAAGANGYGTVNNFGTLTVVDGTYISQDGVNASNFYNRAGGTATFESPTVQGGTGCIATAVNTTTTINGGTYSDAYYPTIENRGNMLITGGTFINTSCSSCDSKYGYTVRSGESSENAYLRIQGKTKDSVKVTGVQGGLAVIGGTADIYNGSYQTIPCEKHPLGASSFYAGYFTGESYKTATTIYGGSFQSCTKTAVLVGNGNPAPDSGAGKESTVMIKGGTFVGGDAAHTAITVNDKENAIGGANITGGTFSSNVSDYVDRSSSAATDDKGNFVIAPNQKEDCVAEIDGKYYKTLDDAITSASDGDTVKLLADFTGSLTIDKPITIDGQNQFTVTGATKVQNGTLKNLTLTTTAHSLLTIGSTEQNKIRMENVTVKYPVNGTNAGAVNVLGGNKADIAITGCIFMNEADNGGVTEGAEEWSYGLYMNEQAAEGSFTFENSRFDGAFRTMLANINGKVTISGNTFVNSIYSNNSGSTSGSGQEATCITTANADVSGISITNNIFDNAGAFYFQKSAGATVAGNTFKFDKFEHYVQLSGSAAQPLDLTDNAFETGENDLVIIDVAAAPVELPAGQKAVSYWAWADTDAESRPADYSSYVYAYNEDGKRIFYPASNAALDAFLKPEDGNIGMQEGDTVAVLEDLTLSNNATIPDGAVLVVGDDATLTVPENTTLTNNGTIVNPERIKGNVTSGGSSSSKQSVTFQTVPSNANVIVKDSDGNDVAPAGDKLYYLTTGTYTYTVSAENYYSTTGTLNVADQAQTVTVELAQISSGGSTSYAITVEKADNGTVTASRTRASKGLTITLTVKADEGYELDTLTVTDKNGKEVKLTDKGDGKYTFAMPASAVTVKASFVKDDTPVDTGLPFTDVKADDWFYEAVKYVYDNKLMDGTSSTTFAPLMTTNRAMIVTILWRQAGSPVANYAMNFSDVESGVWYTEAVRWAAAEGIVKGYSDTVFAPNDTVTREQLAVILYRYAEAKGYDVSAKGDLTSFADSANTSSWATEAMEWAVGSGLITGKDGGKLDPTGTATRAEVATILMRFVAENA